MTAPDEAIILVGGLGTRLRGVVDDLPKPLAPVAGRPFVAWVLDALAAEGLRRVILATGYLGDQIEAACGTRWQGLELAYSRETELRGTGGAIALAAELLEGNTCFVLNGDTMLRLDYARFAGCAAVGDIRLGMAVTRVPDVSRYGAMRVECGRVTGFVEKGATGSGYINAGVYWLDRSLLAAFPSAARFSFEADVLVPAVKREQVAAFTETSGFIDIGVPEDYRRAQNLFGATDDAS